MRIAALILGLLGSIWVFFESMLVGSLFHLFGAQRESEIVAIGLVIGLLGMIASALVIPIPQFSMVMFALCGLLSYGVALNTEYGNQWVYGTLYLLVAGLAGCGWIQKRADVREHRDPATAFAVSGEGNPHRCSSCGEMNAPRANFCSSCGRRIAG